MQTIYELIEQLPENPSEEALQEITDRFRNQEVIYAAFFQPSRNFYLNVENGNSVAYAFTEKAFFDHFSEFMKEQGIPVVCLENNLENRRNFFADLLRSGFTMVMLNNNDRPFSILLSDLMGEDREKFIQNQHILNQEIVLKANFFHQMVQRKKANTNTQLDMFQAILKGKFFFPVDTREMTEGENGQQEGKLIIPTLQNKSTNQKFFPMFTDLFEFQRFDTKHELSVQIVDFPQAREIAKNMDGLVVNPFGVNIILDQPLIQSLMDNADVELTPTRKPERSMGTTSYRIHFETPDVDAVEDMLDILCDELPAKEEVRSVYIRQAFKDGDVRPHYLFVVDADGEQSDIYKFIAKLAMPHANGFDLEFTELTSEYGKKAIGTVRPFYSK